MPKLYWKGHPIYMIGDEYINGYVKILFYSDESPITGTGCVWADMNDVIVEEK